MLSVFVSSGVLVLLNPLTVESFFVALYSGLGFGQQETNNHHNSLHLTFLCIPLVVVESNATNGYAYLIFVFTM